jgi:hypothetical protein
MLKISEQGWIKDKFKREHTEKNNIAFQSHQPGSFPFNSLRELALNKADKNEIVSMFSVGRETRRRGM